MMSSQTLVSVKNGNIPVLQIVLINIFCKITYCQMQGEHPLHCSHFAYDNFFAALFRFYDEIKIIIVEISMGRVHILLLLQAANKMLRIQFVLINF